MKNANKVPNFKKMGEKLMKDLLIDAEKLGLDFIHANFKDEGFYDRSYEPWSKRKTDISYNLLMVTGNLFRSIRATNDGKNKVIFSSDMPYAQIHNEGGIIKQRFTPPEKMRKFFWALYKKTGEQKYKHMALAKEINRTIQIPKRKFMGESWLFDGNLDSHAAKEIIKRFKNIEMK